MRLSVRMPIVRVGGLSALMVSALGICGASPSHADEIDSVSAEVEEIAQNAAALGPRYLRRGVVESGQYASERLIDGENYYRMKDYQRSAIIFMDIIENHSNHAAYGDALFLYSDSLFQARDYLGAREWFKRVIDERANPAVGRYAQRAVERLIEIAIHLDDYEGIEQYFDQLGQTLSPEARYIKGKYFYFKGDMEAAATQFSSIQAEPLLELKANYLLGVVRTRQGRYDEAIEIFQKGRQHTGMTPKEQEIVDLMNLAAGRLYFERDFVEHASESYQLISKNSPYFDAALYEAASVLIRSGDAIRAERILEVLTVAVPDSPYIPKAKMMRGHLLLRTGRYDEAEQVFNEIAGEFGPLEDELEKLVAERSDEDTRAVFAELVQKNMSALDTSAEVPNRIVQWVGEEEDVKQALVLADDLGTAKETVKDTERLIRLLEAVINGPSRLNAIPVLRQAKRKAQQMDNRLGQLRVKLMRIAYNALGEKSDELRRLQEERKKLSDELRALPTTDDQFERREDQSRMIFDRMRKELARNAVRIDQLRAMIVAIERFIADPRYTEGVDSQSIKALEEELGRHSDAVAQMQQDMQQMRGQVDGARYQIGVGDLRDERDEALRTKIRKLAEEERRVLRNIGGDTGQRLERAFAGIDATEGQLDSFERELDSEADRRVEEMHSIVMSERDRISRYRSELRILSDETQDVVADVAFANFSNVRQRFRELILKADVGIIDVAWLRKEEHVARRDELTDERLQDIKSLDDEFQEVRSEEQGTAR